MQTLSVHFPVPSCVACWERNYCLISFDLRRKVGATAWVILSLSLFTPLLFLEQQSQPSLRWLSEAAAPSAKEPAFAWPLRDSVQWWKATLQYLQSQCPQETVIFWRACVSPYLHSWWLDTATNGVRNVWLLNGASESLTHSLPKGRLIFVLFMSFSCAYVTAATDCRGILSSCFIAFWKSLIRKLKKFIFLFSIVVKKLNMCL